VIKIENGKISLASLYGNVFELRKLGSEYALVLAKSKQEFEELVIMVNALDQLIKQMEKNNYD
jgi:hypothetical protein